VPGGDLLFFGRKEKMLAIPKKHEAFGASDKNGNCVFSVYFTANFHKILFQNPLPKPFPDVLIKK
jgi:hypothetical protein